MGDAAGEALIARIEAEIRPRLDTDKYRGGYDCCGCETYEAIVDDVIRLIRGEPLRGGQP